MNLKVPLGDTNDVSNGLFSKVDKSTVHSFPL
jgi:hypothetical protein